MRVRFIYIQELLKLIKMNLLNKIKENWNVFISLLLFFICGIFGMIFTLKITNTDIKNQTWSMGFFVIASVCFALAIALIQIKKK